MTISVEMDVPWGSDPTARSFIVEQLQLLLEDFAGQYRPLVRPILEAK